VEFGLQQLLVGQLRLVPGDRGPGDKLRLSANSTTSSLLRQRALNRGESYHKLVRDVTYANAGQATRQNRRGTAIWSECSKSTFALGAAADPRTAPAICRKAYECDIASPMLFRGASGC
jgi:Tn3 transposase DDE domain